MEVENKAVKLPRKAQLWTGPGPGLWAPKQASPSSLYLLLAVLPCLSSRPPQGASQSVPQFLSPRSNLTSSPHAGASNHHRFNPLPRRSLQPANPPPPSDLHPLLPRRGVSPNPHHTFRDRRRILHPQNPTPPPPNPPPKPYTSTPESTWMRARSKQCATAPGMCSLSKAAATMLTPYATPRQAPC